MERIAKVNAKWEAGYNRRRARAQTAPGGRRKCK
jgi:hypothetical protein